MTVLLQPNRTISLILMVPDVEVMSTSLSGIIEIRDRSESPADSKHEPSSVPVYHGSIIRVEENSDDTNASDLIIRVPNFQHRSLSPTSSKHQPPVVAETESKRLKRRAPLCPLIQNSTNRSIPDDSSHSDDGNGHRTIETTKRMWDATRLTTGLRSLSRALTNGCKPKRSANIVEMNFPPLLPDVEIISPKFEVPIVPRKTIKQQQQQDSIPTTTPPKFITPTIRSIKRKHFKIRKKPSTSIAMDQSTTIERSTTKIIQNVEIDKTKKQNSPKIITTFIGRLVDNVEEQPTSAESDHPVERPSTDVVQPKHPIEVDSSSIDRYSTISTLVPTQHTATEDDAEEIPSTAAITTTTTGISYRFDDEPLPSIVPHRPFHIQTSILQPDISVVRYGINDLTTRTDCLLPEEQMFTNEQIDYPSDRSQFIHIDIEQQDEDLEQRWYTMIPPSEDTIAEFYEVTYEVDPQRQNDLYSEKRPVYLANVPGTLDLVRFEKPDSFYSTDQPVFPLKINIDPLEYKGLASPLTTWLPIVTQSEHQNRPPLEKAKSITFDSPTSPTITREKCRSIDDLTRTDNDSTSVHSSSNTFTRHCTLRRSHSYDGFGIYVSSDVETRRQHFIHQVEQTSPGDEAGLKPNDRILCINGTSVVDEDYTVVLQLIQHGLQTDTLDFDILTDAQTS